MYFEKLYKKDNDVLDDDGLVFVFCRRRVIPFVELNVSKEKDFFYFIKYQQLTRLHGLLHFFGYDILVPRYPVQVTTVQIASTALN